MPETSLKAGDRYPCPRCREEHVIDQPYKDDSTAARTHLYVTCRGQRYFVGQDLGIEQARAE